MPICGRLRIHKVEGDQKEVEKRERKGGEAAMLVEMAVTKRARQKKAGSNMRRYDEILARHKALEGKFDRKNKKVVEEWEEIRRLHGEAMEDGEEWTCFI